MLETVIIGAGPAGLVAAKECLEAGLSPVVFEKEADWGGTWHGSSGKVWGSMRSNLSQFHLGFSDFPWPDAVPDFPTRSDVWTYLRNYAHAHALDNAIQTGVAVTGVRPGTRGGTWLLELNGAETVACSNLIVANGFLNRAHVPEAFAGQAFKGPILHSQQYRTASDFDGRRVVVVGSGASAYEIAADLARRSEVRHVLRQAAWVTGRYEPGTDRLLPADVFAHCYAPPGAATGARDQNKAQIDRYRALYGNPGAVHRQLHVSEDPDHRARAVLSDDYLALVSAGNIRPYKGAVCAVRPEGIQLDSGHSIRADAVILCTGYDYVLPVRDRTVRQKLRYRAATPNAPLNLLQQTVHPGLKNTWFVGAFRGTFWGLLELQARWAAAVLTAQVPPPSEPLPRAALHPAAPDAEPLPCDYAAASCSLARRLHAYPTALADAAGSGRVPMLPADFRQTGIGANPAAARQQRERLEQRLRQVAAVAPVTEPATRQP